MDKDTKTYNLNPNEVLDKILPKQLQHLRKAVVFNKKTDDSYDDILKVSITHDGTPGNESHVIFDMLQPLLSRPVGEYFGVPCRLRWNIGHIRIDEKQGIVIAAGRKVKGVAQCIQIPVKMEVIKEL